MDHAHKRTVMVIAAFSLLAVGCAKKKLAVSPPPPPAPAVAHASMTKPTTPPVQAAAVTKPPATTTPASRYPNAATRARIDQLLAKIEDAYFDYDKAALRPDAMKALNADSTELRDCAGSE
jgi:outer membrane protein OmpA-like peptidoglycan-associated protein